MFGEPIFWIIFLSCSTLLSLLLCFYFAWKFRTAGKEAVSEPVTEVEGEVEEEDELHRECCGKLFESIQEGVVIHKIIRDDSGEPVDYILEKVNPAFKCMTEVDPDELVGKSATQLAEEGKSNFWEFLKPAIKNNKPSYFEAFVPEPDNHFKFFFFPINNKYFGTVFNNITELKQHEESLAAEKEKLTVTLQSICEGVITTDIHGKVILMNSVAEDMTGWLEKEALGQSIRKVLKTTASGEVQQGEVQQGEVQQGEVQQGEVQQGEAQQGEAQQGEAQQGEAVGGEFIERMEEISVFSRDNQEYVVEKTTSPVRNLEEKIVGSVIALRDITEKQRLEKEVAKTERLESLGVLAGGIAHDFNNILASILGNISLAQIFAGDKEKAMVRLQSVEKASLRARDLTQRLLTFSKGGAPVRSMASLKDILVDSSTFILGGSNVRSVFEIQNNLWKAEVDEGQISQVIQNLVLNADQAMAEGGTIFIQAENISFEEDAGVSFPGCRHNNYVMITIRDEGVGIPETYMTKIFDPFFTTKQKGNGLGLSISYSIIKRHEGHITVDSTPGKGASFTIYLPVGSDSQIYSEDKKPEEEKQEEEKLITGTGRVLVMDDDESIIEFLTVLLDKLGYVACFASEGAAAVKLYEEALKSGEKFDVVVLDLTVPGGMGGRKALKKLKKIDPDVKAIVSSGHSLEPVMSEYLASGFKGVLAKPYKPRELSLVLRDVLRDS